MLAGYTAIEAPHKLVHSHGQAAVRRFRGGEFDAGLAALGEMERASMEVLKHLETMAQAGESDPNVLCVGLS